MTSRTAALAALLILVLVTPAYAQRKRVAVSDCGGASQATWACDTDAGAAVDLVMSVVTPALVALTGQESTIEFWFRMPVPDWWKAGVGMCRPPSVVDVSFDGSTTSCVDPMSEAGVMGGHSYRVGPWSGIDPEGPIDEYRVRLRTISGVMPAQPPGYGAVAEGSELFLFRLRIDRRNTVSADACSGCGACAIVLFRRAILLQPAGIGDHYFDGVESLFYLQGDPGDELDCPRTAARSSTWGGVKSLYR